MDKSESIANLAKALVEVQKTDLFALTDKDNPFFRSKYADLSSVWIAARKPLTENGLSVVQTMDTHTNGVIIETTLLHVSGEYMTGKLLIQPEKNTPQGIGSAITYGRRYALAAIVGIAPEDDDGEGAMNRTRAPKATAPKLPSISPKEKELIDGIDKIEHQSHCNNWYLKHHKDVASMSAPEAKRVADHYLSRIAVKELKDERESLKRKMAAEEAAAKIKEAQDIFSGKDKHQLGD